MNKELEELVEKWREDAEEFERLGYWEQAYQLKRCADEIEELL